MIKTVSVAEHEFEVLVDQPMQLGESPIWSAEERCLYWIDISGHAVHRMNPETAAHTVWPVPSEPGCIALTDNSRHLLVAMRTGISLLDTVDGCLTPYVAAPYDPALGRFNDGCCDAAGRLWIGSLWDSRERPGGSLYCLEQGKIRDMHIPVTVSNGVAFSPDHKALYHADTTAHRITRYEFDLENASLSDGGQFKQFPTERGPDYGGRPDGAAVDVEGAYWCAMYEGGRLLRLAPSGETLEEIPLPVRCPTMPCFGGKDLQTLYFTSARQGRPAEELDSYPLSGFVLGLRVNVPGQASRAYRTSKAGHRPSKA